MWQKILEKNQYFPFIFFRFSLLEQHFGWHFKQLKFDERTPAIQDQYIHDPKILLFEKQIRQKLLKLNKTPEFITLLFRFFEKKPTCCTIYFILFTLLFFCVI